MRKVISIDPGLTKVAWAMWEPETGKLIRAGLVRRDHEVATERAQKWLEMAEAVDNEIFLSCGDEIWLVLEVPQVYSGNRKEDPNDLIDLAGVLGAIIGLVAVGHVEWSPVPRDWKGQLPKHISEARVNERLTGEEKNNVDWPIKSLAHNVYDALHLGLVYLEREGYREIPLPSRYPKNA